METLSRSALLAWIGACAVAETIGMTAAASAAVMGGAVGDPWLGLALIVAGGLVEGVALGVLQGRWLRRRFGVSAVGWAAVTTVFAGLGWAGVSAPAALSPDGGEGPAPLVAVAAGLGLGIAMGALLGIAQALVLRSAVRHPWRWVGVSAAAWTPTMAIIFLGATAPDPTWPAGWIVGTATVTGALAGAVLGVVSGPLLRFLDADPAAQAPRRTPAP